MRPRVFIGRLSKPRRGRVPSKKLTQAGFVDAGFKDHPIGILQTLGGGAFGVATAFGGQKRALLL